MRQVIHGRVWICDHFFFSFSLFFIKKKVPALIPFFLPLANISIDLVHSFTSLPRETGDYTHIGKSYRCSLVSLAEQYLTSRCRPYSMPISQVCCRGAGGFARLMQLLQGDSCGRHVPPTSIFPSV